MIKWNEVTWYSRLVAIFVFFGLIPILAFRVGVRYQEVVAVYQGGVDSIALDK